MEGRCSSAAVVVILLGFQKKKRPDFRVELSTSKSPVRIRTQETDAVVSRPLEIHEEQTPVAFKRPAPKPAKPTRIPQEEKEDNSDIEDDDEKEREKQILDAQYSFRSEVNDPLSDSNIVREEKREDGAVEGMYSYSDGFFRRTVRYRADRLGYRVLSEDVEPLGDGPKPDPNGRAKIAVMSTSGVSSHYTVSASDITKPRTPLKEEKGEQKE
ncbi:hypothetical protein B566_EDAN013649 [Ephemera danica]|nr:hypothetical protein B566_EDAN013649 [Ephemera danica]